LASRARGLKLLLVAAVIGGELWGAMSSAVGATTAADLTPVTLAGSSVLTANSRAIANGRVRARGGGLFSFAAVHPQQQKPQ
jgi:hypothetical protein